VHTDLANNILVFLDKTYDGLSIVFGDVLGLILNLFLIEFISVAIFLFKLFLAILIL